jgi:small subunit ribosomal protein S18
MANNKRVFKNTRPSSGKNCLFCQQGIKPNYKDVETLSQFITERKKIASREYTGICAKHQRQLAREIKRARHLALIPFISQIH